MPDYTAGHSAHRDAPLQFELLEDRCCLSVLGNVDDRATEARVRTNTDTTGGTGFSAGQQDDARFAQDQLGLFGQGQTVVIIDSGVAYDHLALGGGFGASYRVVGGWDFAENDADPYDDAPGGLHGTHVAGIVGSDDARYPGMAPQVDLVALRVFDDDGNAAFADIERALQWVHQHESSFTHAITTVNLSLGSDWNSGQVPGWGVLEDELSQLAQDGILVVASAGNDFASYGQPGLTYPAASPWVIPVGSVDRVGQISSFSQRHERMLAALGEWVTSTAPDYLFGFNGVADDYTDLSGTSMAAPVVAGASVLVREALQHVGAADQSLSAVQSYLFEAADWVLDSVTHSSYRRLNLRDALTAVVGTDESTGAAHPVDLGVATGPLSRSGVMQRASDEDYLVLTAHQPGRLRIDVDWQGRPDQRPQVSVAGMVAAGPWDFPVSAGQQVVVGLRGQGGIGRYDVRVNPLYVASPPAAAPANMSEYRVRWAADTTGEQTVIAELDHPEYVAELVVRSMAGETLARVPNPNAYESITIGVQGGHEYEVAVVGQRPTAQLSIVDGDGNQVTSSGGGTRPLWQANGRAMPGESSLPPWGCFRSPCIDWRITTSVVDLDVVQEESVREWLHELKLQDEKMACQLAQQFHPTDDRFIERVDESWEHDATSQRSAASGLDESASRVRPPDDASRT